MKKFKFYRYPVKVGQLLSKIICFFLKKNVVNCMKKYRFYRYPVKVGQLLCKLFFDHCFLVEVGQFL